LIYFPGLYNENLAASMKSDSLAAKPFFRGLAVCRRRIESLKEVSMRKTLTLVAVCFFLLVMGGCVSSSKFEKKVAEADALEKEFKALQQQHTRLVAENSILKGKHDRLTSDYAQLSNEKDKLSTDRDELDRVLKARSDSLSNSISELREKNAALETANAVLKESIAGLRKAKEEEVKNVSKTYEHLMQEMKGEIAQGQVTITELKGKLTLDVVDRILFASGEAEVKPEGLAVLQRVIEIVKEVPDKVIRIEGHTDNVKIGGTLARKYPTNWELSAARALNVTRYLEKQGIDPALLAAVAYGEHKPIADNGTPEGRAKNRRIAIILQPKD
jgi:chemotaxis protein MotB